MVITSPKEVDKKFMYQLDIQCSNNQAEYEAIIIGLKLLKSLNVKNVQVMGDSQLVINQLLGKYRCNNQILEEYVEEAKTFLEHFVDIIITHVCRFCNEVANDLAEHALGYKSITPIINNSKLANAMIATIGQQSSKSAN